MLSRKDERATVVQVLLDSDLNQQLGALAQYGPSRPLISLVFSGDASQDESIDWELQWLEVIDNRITGRYALVKPKSVTINGAFMKYKSFRTGKETTFQPSSGPGGECTIGSRK